MLCLAFSITKNNHSSPFIKMLGYTIKTLFGFISTKLKLLHLDAHLNYIIAAWFPFIASRVAIGQ